MWWRCSVVILASEELFDQKAYNWTAPEPTRSLGSAMISNSWHILLGDVQRQRSIPLLLFLNLQKSCGGLNVTKMPSNPGLMRHKCRTVLHVYPHSRHFALLLILIESVCCRDKVQHLHFYTQSIKLQLIGSPRTCVTGPSTGLYTEERDERRHRIRLKNDCQMNT